jgi:7-cyano-7-deazaguanine synthase in queuosine biosynthesis
MTNENKRSLIFFSGGLESTFLLYSAIMQSKAVSLFSWKHGFNVPGGVREAHAREHVKQEIKRLALERGLPFDVEEIPDTNSRTYYPTKAVSSSCYQQLYEHIDMAFYLASTEKYSEIHLGLCGSDDTAMRHRDLLEYWGLKCRVFHSDRLEFTPLKLVLDLTLKQQILFDIPKTLLDKIWYCASPNIMMSENDIEKAFIPCGKCTKCLDHQMAQTLSNSDHLDFRRGLLRNSSDQVEAWLRQHGALSNCDDVEVIQFDGNKDGCVDQKETP